MIFLFPSFGETGSPKEMNEGGIFFRKPPASVSSRGNEFIPEWSILLLSEKIIMDRSSFEELMEDNRQVFGKVRDTLYILNEEGFIDLQSYGDIISRNRKLLSTMVDRDLSEPHSWLPLLRKSRREWLKIVGTFRGDLISGLRIGQLTSDEEFLMSIMDHLGEFDPTLMEYISDFSTLESDISEDVARAYFSYINTNIILSEAMGAGIYDWSDMRPLYQDKFLRVAKTGPIGQPEADSIKQLFSISFPEFSSWTPKNIVKALRDKRINDLRALIGAATLGEIEFDAEFALNTMKEVFRREQITGKFRNITSYATIPLGFLQLIGTPVQKIVEETVMFPISAYNRREHRWFFLLNELSDKR